MRQQHTGKDGNKGACNVRAYNSVHVCQLGRALNKQTTAAPMINVSICICNSVTFTWQIGTFVPSSGLQNGASDFFVFLSELCERTIYEYRGSCRVSSSFWQYE